MSASGTPGFTDLARNDGTLRVTWYGAGVVHCCFFRGEAPRGALRWGFVEGLSPIAHEVLGEGGAVRLACQGWTLDVGEGGELTLRGPDGKVSAEVLSYALEDAVVAGEATHHAHLSLRAFPGDGHYGLGQHQGGWLDHRGHTLRVWHDYDAPGGETVGVPFLVTPRPSGLILDNPSRVEVSVGECVSWRAEVAECVSWVLIGAGSIDGVYGGYRLLTGVTPLLPRKALGYIQCKQRYASARELLDVARTHRAKGYAGDLLVVDWFHWKHLGDLALDPEFWPDPAGMNAQLRALDFETMISCWPRFMRESQHYAALEARGHFMRDHAGETVYGTEQDRRGALIDTTNPAAAAWFWNTIHASYGAAGFTSWWLDENEPDVNPHPYRLHAGPGAEVHNLYPFTHLETVHDGHVRDLGTRPLILSRAAYLGAQRFGATFWSSDIEPSWDVLRRQVPTGLNFCASGLSYWSSDIGGWQPLGGWQGELTALFPEGAPPVRHPDFAPPQALLIRSDVAPYRPEDACADYPELYVRWFQYGAFCPTFRAHGTRPGNELWSYGPEVEAILAKYLALRYELLPYLNTQAWHTHRTGAPFMRALWMDFPGQPALLGVSDAYLLGPALLVAPVTAQGQTQRGVVLPGGADWYDFWTNERFAGGQTVTARAPIETLPLFVRAGSVLPLARGLRHALMPPESWEVRVYAGADGAFTLFHDDGVSLDYLTGPTPETRLSWNDARGELRVEGERAALFPPEQHAHWRRVIGGLNGEG